MESFTLISTLGGAFVQASHQRNGSTKIKILAQASKSPTNPQNLRQRLRNGLRWTYPAQKENGLNS